MPSLSSCFGSPNACKSCQGDQLISSHNPNKARQMYISSCEELKSFLENGMPPLLLQLSISKCQTLV
ncbi:hypothetical protein I3842_16G083200 [Carya illinoinensis]|uniref:Uncharacterized protein n=1 Tax=Carya illinoinensis TaxID=32201 RepID=A0A922A0X8_CARIL|nr:hypothetical protein I3842_16G083200 [Carya illinoinensis]